MSSIFRNVPRWFYRDKRIIPDRERDGQDQELQREITNFAGHLPSIDPTTKDDLSEVSRSNKLEWVSNWLKLSQNKPPPFPKPIPPEFKKSNSFLPLLSPRTKQELRQSTAERSERDLPTGGIDNPKNMVQKDVTKDTFNSYEGIVDGVSDDNEVDDEPVKSPPPKSRIPSGSTTKVKVPQNSPTSGYKVRPLSDSPPQLPPVDYTLSGAGDGMFYKQYTHKDRKPSQESMNRVPVKPFEPISFQSDLDEHLTRRGKNQAGNGINRTFTDSRTVHNKYPFLRGEGVGPINRAHTPVMNLSDRQRTVLGNDNWYRGNAAERSACFVDQKRQKVHEMQARLKDMIRE